MYSSNIHICMHRKRLFIYYKFNFISIFLPVCSCISTLYLTGATLQDIFISDMKANKVKFILFALSTCDFYDIKPKVNFGKQTSGYYSYPVTSKLFLQVLYVSW